ncbi:MAG: hypothetical protein EZS28_046208, partial [Streblomastix strix]
YLTGQHDWHMTKESSHGVPSFCAAIIFSFFGASVVGHFLLQESPEWLSRGHSTIFFIIAWVFYYFLPKRLRWQIGKGYINLFLCTLNSMLHASETASLLFKIYSKQLKNGFVVAALVSYLMNCASVRLQLRGHTNQYKGDIFISTFTAISLSIIFLFSTYFPPSITQISSDYVPLIFENLGQVISDIGEIGKG